MRIFLLLLLVTTIWSVETYESGQLIPKGVFRDGYNAPGGIATTYIKGNYFVDVSFIYWQARQKGMDFGYAIPANPNIKTGENIYSHFNFHPGFKVGLGLDIQYDGWATFATYTRLRTHESISSQAPSWAIGIEPTWLADTYNNGTNSGPQINQVMGAKDSWKFAYDMIDFGFNRPSYLARTFLFNPFAGFRVGLVTQHLQMNYSLTNIGVVTSRLNQMTHYLGPRFGAGGKFFVGYGLRFEGNTAVAFPFQVVRVKMKRDNFSNPTVLDTNVGDRIRFFAPNIDMSMGLGWGSYFHQKKWFLDLSLTYEMLFYWSQNWMRHVKDAVDQRIASEAGDLQLHGFTGTVTLNF
jgi:hypothetical protein